MTRSAFLCPACGGDTGVQQSRPEPGRVRRQRRCLDRECSGRVWTVELVEAAPPPDMVLVKRSVLRRLRSLVEAICASKDENACASPDGNGIPVIDE